MLDRSVLFLPMRFDPPPRLSMATDTFDHPAFAGHAPWRALLDGREWPAIAALNDAITVRHVDTGRGLAFVDAAQVDDAHYEARIHATGQIATRTDNWHDLFNALVWARCPAIKSALNQRQAADLARVGPQTRTRGQQALTHFDEAGIVVVLNDPALIQAWDRHDWTTLFLTHREAWRDGRILWCLVGHAVLEHALDPAMWLVAKALVFDAGDVPMAGIDRGAIDLRTAALLREAEGLDDPQQLRPLPISGIPGWRAGPQDAAFYRDGPCFRPRREHRRYPPPSRW
jgi:hypothetical protein